MNMSKTKSNKNNPKKRDSEQQEAAQRRMLRAGATDLGDAGGRVTSSRGAGAAGRGVVRMLAVGGGLRRGRRQRRSRTSATTSRGKERKRKNKKKRKTKMFNHGIAI